MPTLKKDIPYAWFWLGKPLHKGHSRGERIRPIYINRDGELCTISRRSSRASLSVEKPLRRACELHPDQSRASSPSRSERVNLPTRRFCGVCSPVETESETTAQTKLQCPCCQKASSPLRPNGPAQAPYARTVAPAPHYYHVCPIFHEHSHGYQTPTPASSPQVPAQGETTRGKNAQAKCPCCQTPPAPEPEVRRQTCIHSDDCRGECVFVDVGLVDDTISETSVEVNSESDRGEECHQCGHFVFAIPCGVVH